MSISPLEAARRVCARSGWTVSNLQLQKILYLAQMAYMGEHGGRPLISGKFQAWDYGPVLPEVYKEVSRFGRHSIQDIFGTGQNVDSEEEQALDSCADMLFDCTSSELVAITHWQSGAWAKNYLPGVRDLIIPDRDILEEYSARVAYREKKRKQANESGLSN